MRRRHSGEPTSARFVADWQQRVAKQKQLIEELKRKGHPTEQAQAALIKQQLTLAALRNHDELMQNLLSPDLKGTPTTVADGS